MGHQQSRRRKGSVEGQEGREKGREGEREELISEEEREKGGLRGGGERMFSRMECMARMVCMARAARAPGNHC
jgi:hypothetical protein